MSNWIDTTLGQVVTIRSGQSPSNYVLSPSGQHPFVKVDDLNNCNKYQKDAREYAKQSKDLVPKGSVIFAKRGAAIVTNKIRIAAVPLLMDSNMMALTARDGLVCGEFLYYLLEHEKLFKIADMSPIPQINNKHINPYQIRIPPIAEQSAIVGVIGIWDKAIDHIEALLRNKEAQRKALTQRLLTGRRRFSRFSATWSTVHLGDVFRERVEKNRTDLPLLSITTAEGVIPRGNVERKDSSSEYKSAYLRICPGDIGYNTMRMWQGVSGLSRLEGIVSPAYTVITPDASVDAEFMALLFKFQPVVHLFWRYSQGMVDDTLNLKFHNFAKIKVTIPDKEEQTAIAGVFRLVDREISLLRNEVVAFQEQKKGLMQQLLTGKRRVNVSAAA